MIGGSSNDAQAARAAGCPVLLVTYGYNHGEPVRALDAGGLVDSLPELHGSQDNGAYILSNPVRPVKNHTVGIRARFRRLCPAVRP